MSTEKTDVFPELTPAMLREIADSFDEEFEMELDDHRLDGLVDAPPCDSMNRHLYFK